MAGGDEYSQHLVALAMDVSPLYHSQQQLAQRARQLGLYVAGGYRTHVHLQAHPAGYLRRWALA